MSTSRAPAAAHHLLPDEASPYRAFYEGVAAAQVAEWAPSRPSRVLDLSVGGQCFAARLVAAGHEVVQVRTSTGELRTATAEGVDDAQGVAGSASRLPGRLLPVVADSRSLGFLADTSVDAILAEGRTLSRCLATEVTALDLHRVLRPGGRLLLVVDSLTSGLSRLADLGRWAELADVRGADVVLVPAGPGEPDGAITRCFLPAEVAALLGAVGFEVDWVRARTVLSPAAVERAVEQGGAGALADLVATEVAMATDRAGEAGGLHLVASARRPVG